MRNKIRTYTGWPLQISFLIIAMLFNSVANAQRLNSDGLKMVNKLSINNGNICFDAEFIYKGNKLSKFIFTTRKNIIILIGHRILTYIRIFWKETKIVSFRNHI